MLQPVEIVNVRTFFVKSSRVLKKSRRVENFSVPTSLLSCIHPLRFHSPLDRIVLLGVYIYHGVRRQQTAKYGRKSIFTLVELENGPFLPSKACVRAKNV